MTRPLRQAHLRIWIVASLLMLAIFVASLIARRDTTPRNTNFHWSDLK